MLDEEGLQAALLDAVKGAGVCRRLCSHGSELLENNGGYRVWHNGVGSDTSDQTVTDAAVLGWTQSVMVLRFTDWLKALHGGKVEQINDYAPVTS